MLGAIISETPVNAPTAEINTIDIISYILKNL
jgi:hypothetical protein